MAAAAKTAVVLGAGPGLGSSIVRLFASRGFKVAAASRSGAPAAATGPDAERIRSYRCDAADAASVEGLVAAVEADLGPIDVAVLNVGTFRAGSVLSLPPAALEQAWRVGCLSGLHFGQAVGKRMQGRGAGCILFTGATASLRGSAGFAALAVPKFGLRALAQCMARELGPAGVHVAHVVVDGVIDTEAVAAMVGPASSSTGGAGGGAGGGDGGDKRLSPDALAETYWHLAHQHRSAWTHELDVRPYAEKW